jgi:hypothetical protein
MCHVHNLKELLDLELKVACMDIFAMRKEKKTKAQVDLKAA